MASVTEKTQRTHLLVFVDEKLWLRKKDKKKENRQVGEGQGRYLEKNNLKILLSVYESQLDAAAGEKCDL